MLAYRAELGSLLSDHDVTAVGALPDRIFLAGEYNALGDILKELPVTLFMSFLDRAHALEKECNLVESFFPGSLCEAVIHVGPLEVLAVGGIQEILLGRRHLSAVQELEPYLRVFLLVLGSLFEQLAYLDITILGSLRGIIEVLGVCLALARERGTEVLFGL